MLITISFVLHGRGNEIDAARKILGRACLLSGFNVQDFIIKSEEESPSQAYVKIDTDPILSRDLPENPDYVLIFDSSLNANDILKNSKDNISIFNSESKPKDAVIKKNKIKAFSLDTTEFDTTTAMLGALAKNFNKLSVKNLKSAIKIEKYEGSENIEDGHKAVK